MTEPGDASELFPATSSFLQQQVVHDPINAVQAVLTLAMESAQAGVSKGQLILDTDVFRQFELSPGEADIWDLLERLRVYKNQVFFSTLTEEAWRKYQ